MTTPDPDAFGALTQPRTVMPRMEPAPKAPEPEPPPKPIKPEMRLIPERHRERFTHSSTWWRNNIEIYRHRETGRYLFLSREGAGDDEIIKGYLYQAAHHTFVEISVDSAIAMAEADDGDIRRSRTP